MVSVREVTITVISPAESQLKDIIRMATEIGMAVPEAIVHIHISQREEIPEGKEQP